MDFSFGFLDNLCKFVLGIVIYPMMPIPFVSSYMNTCMRNLKGGWATWAKSFGASGP